MFLSVDPAAQSYPSWSPYSYCQANPVKYTDPNGEVVETAVDVVSVGLSAYDFCKDPSWANGGWLALDIVCAAVPFLPAVGAVRHAGKIDDIIDAGKALLKSDEAVDVARAADKAGEARKVVPNPHGRKGGPAHRKGVKRAVDRAKQQFSDCSVVEEGMVKTPGGVKSRRFGDVTVYKNGKPIRVYQVGDVLADGVTPISRERKAIGDILRQGVGVEVIPKQ